MEKHEIALLKFQNHILVLLGRFTFFPRVAFLIRTNNNNNNNNNNQALKTLFSSLSLSLLCSRNELIIFYDRDDKTHAHAQRKKEPGYTRKGGEKEWKKEGGGLL
jgi:hypothetical protein